MAEGKKFDSGKAPIIRGLVNYFPKALQAVANVSAYGATKYAVAYESQNWRAVESAIERYDDARGRHIVGELLDGNHDPESHLLHAAHQAWNSLAYLELLLTEGVPERVSDHSA